MFSDVGQDLSAYVRYVFWSRPGLNLRTLEMIPGEGQGLISVRQKDFLE
jgi:hypothetical protein